MDLDEEIDRLYGTPLDEFVRERDELARRLSKAGDRDGAARVKALRKPTVGAWALNQAVRRRRVETDALIATGRRLRAAHEDLLSGGDPAVLREAMEEERSLTSAIADCAEAIASETGKAGPALRDRVRATLHAATLDDGARDELSAGRFIREREAVGLGSFGGELPAAATATAPRRKSRPKGGAHGDEARAQARARTRPPPRRSRASAGRGARGAERVRGRPRGHDLAGGGGARGVGAGRGRRARGAPRRARALARGVEARAPAWSASSRTASREGRAARAGAPPDP